MKFSIIVPCFNEATSIEENLLKIHSFIKSNLGIGEFEIIAVNDGSYDNTFEVLKNLETKISHLKVLNHQFNVGRGAAMKTGISGCKGDYVMFLDADLSYDVDHIRDVFDTFQRNENLDAIIISPYMKGGVAQNIPLSRLILSRAANWILSGFFTNEISTVTSMVRAYRGDIIRNLPLYEDGKELHLEILKKLVLLGAKIEEIPGRLIWKEKKTRNARLNKRKVAKAAGKHLIYGFVAKPTRFLGSLASVIFFLSLYEFCNVAKVLVNLFKESDAGIWKDLWISLGQTFSHSPHTVIIAVTCMLVSLQMFSFLAIFTVMKFQHDESQRHLLAILQNRKG
jgi:dolichol-phosphate mannosyltransferase